MENAHIDNDYLNYDKYEKGVLPIYISLQFYIIRMFSQIKRYQAIKWQKYNNNKSWEPTIVTRLQIIWHNHICSARDKW